MFVIMYVPRGHQDAAEFVSKGDTKAACLQSAKDSIKEFRGIAADEDCPEVESLVFALGAAWIAGVPFEGDYHLVEVS